MSSKQPPLNSSTGDPDSPTTNTQAWKTGVTAHFPVVGIGALCAVFLCVFASVAIVVTSNGDPISSWSVSPSVLLSITTSIAGVCLAKALMYGSAITWWRRSLHGTTISDLHNYWKFGESSVASILSGKKMNLIALASIVTTLTAASGPLLQRASTVINQDTTKVVTLSASVAAVLPSRYTGVITDRTYIVSAYTDPFVEVMHAYTARSSIVLNTTGCNGICYASLQGAGFAYNCTDTTQAFDLTNFIFPNGTINPDVGYGQTLFSTNMTRDGAGTIRLSVMYKSTPECKGDLVVRTCIAKGAVLEYPIIIQNSTIALQADWHNDTTISFASPLDEISLTSTFGGVVLAINDKFASNALVYFTGGAGWAMKAEGATARENMDRSFASFGDCSITWRDPTYTILGAIREIFLRTSVAASNEQNKTQFVQAVETKTEAVYQAHYEFLALNSVILLVAAGITLTLYYGWWELGRAVSMSPVETAKAFGAPILHGLGWNANAESLVRDGGDRELKYGEVVLLNGVQIPAYVELDESGVERQLVMSKPEWVRYPTAGTIF